MPSAPYQKTGWVVRSTPLTCAWSNAHHLILHSLWRRIAASHLGKASALAVKIGWGAGGECAELGALNHHFYCYRIVIHHCLLQDRNSAFKILPILQKHSHLWRCANICSCFSETNSTLQGFVGAPPPHTHTLFFKDLNSKPVKGKLNIRDGGVTLQAWQIQNNNAHCCCLSLSV